MEKLQMILVYLTVGVIGVFGTVLWVQNDYSWVYGWGTNIAMSIGFCVSTMISGLILSVLKKEGE